MNKVTSESVILISQIAQIVEEAEKMKGAYYFKSPGSASSRRSYEKSHSHGPIEWTENGHKYSAEYNVRCSCKNVYAKGYYFKDGEKTTLTAIKNSLKRLSKEI